MRLMIETRKDQAARMKWAITAFFAKPDGVHPWTDWLRIGLEDVLVLDAWTTFKKRSRAGDLLALKPIDGAPIKPILGEDGRLPMPWVQGGEIVWPEAYQQILKGLGLSFGAGIAVGFSGAQGRTDATALKAANKAGVSLALT